MITLLAYIADIIVIGSYLLVVRGKSIQWMNWANFLGAFPIGGVEILAGAWPALVITVAFGAIGLIGVLTSFRRSGTV